MRVSEGNFTRGELKDSKFIHEQSGIEGQIDIDATDVEVSGRRQEEIWHPSAHDDDRVVKRGKDLTQID